MPNPRDMLALGAFTRRSVLAGGAAACAALATPRFGWAQEGEASAPRQGGILKVAFFFNPSSLDPQTGTGGTDLNLLYNIYDTLVEFELDTLTPKPGLAESWEFTDPQTLVLHLRQGIVFHDGTPFDAAAVKANFERAQTNDRSRIKTDLQSIDTIDAADPAKVVLHLKYPDSALPLALSDRAGMMASPAAFTQYGDDFDRNPVGTGSWKFVEWRDGDRVSLTRNENYWKPGRPYLDGIEFQIILDVDTGLRSVLSGQNDLVLGVNHAQVERLKSNPSVVVSIGNSIYCRMLYLTMGVPATAVGDNINRPYPLEDVRIRQALNYAIDRELFNDVALAGLGEVAHLLVPKAHWAYDEQAASRYPHDVEKARALLAEAGYPDGITLKATSNSDQRATREIEVIAGMLSEAGINLELVFGNNSEVSERWRAGDSDFHSSAWTGRPDPSVSYSSLFLKDGYYNVGGVEPSPELSELIRQSRSSTDLAERAAVFAQANRLEREFALFVPIVFVPQVTVFTQKVKGFVPSLIGKQRFNDVYLES